MRRNIAEKTLACLLILTGLLFLAGCVNPLDPSKVRNVPADGEGSFTLEIGGVQAGRTILPATVQSDFMAYTLVFSASGREDIREERGAENISSAVSLGAGTWNLEVTAYLDNGRTKAAARGRLTDIMISGGVNVSRSLSLAAIVEAGATGTFQWRIGYPSEVTMAKVIITPLDPETGTPEQTLYFIGGEPVVDNRYSSPLTLNTGYYRVAFSLSNGKHETGREEYLHIYKHMDSFFEYTFTKDHFTVYSVISGEDSGPGTLRYAIANAAANSTILIESGVETISLNSRLTINQSLNILGNGAALTRSASWTTVNDSSQLLYTNGETVKISRLHFKDGRASYYGAAIRNEGTLNLESCVFSGNQNSGAVYNRGTMSATGCTFYGNRASQGGAIYHYSGTLTLEGNLFYGNTAPSSPVVYRNSGTVVTSRGYNAVDAALGADTNQSGWPIAPGDKTISGNLPISFVSFRLLPGSGAANVISVLPDGYPTADFYGNPISNGAAAGAVQSTVSGSGNILTLPVNDSSRGSVGASPAPDVDGFVSGEVTLTANPQAGYFFGYWLVNGVKTNGPSPLSLSLTGHTTVQAVFGRELTNFSDTEGSATTSGTLRHALTNAAEYDYIRFSGVTPGTTTIELTSALPNITSNITIEGNGLTLNRGLSSYDTVNIYYGGTVNISRFHFKGAAISNNGTLNLESCVFSGNNGNAVSNSGTMSVKGCTFYGNMASRGAAIYNSGGALTFTGNLFYGNTASYGSAVVYGSGTSGGYNVVDVALGTGDTQSGWNAASGDKTISVLPISPVSFKIVSGSGAVNVINALPDGYPAADFYGDPIESGAAAGAVQARVSGSGYALGLSENDSSRGGTSASLTPDADGLVSGTVTLTASSQSGYVFGYWLVNGVKTNDVNPLSLSMTTHTTVQAVFGSELTDFTDPVGNSTTPGTLRHALANARVYDYIRFSASAVTPGTTTIALSSRLSISGNITIEGNGLTLTRSASWTTVNDSSQLLGISGYGTVNISRLHFKDGRASYYGAAIRNEYGTLNLESCVFSGNNDSAVYNPGTMNVKGCTFYGNRAYQAGAIYNDGGTLTLTGNLFSANTASNSYPVVYSTSSGAVTSGGHNAVDAVLGTDNTQGGWTAGTGDKTISGLPISPVSFKVISGSGAANVITTLPTGYPTTDFYGNSIANGAAAGAVQTTVDGVYVLDLSVNDSSRGSVSASAPNADGLYSGAVTLTASPQSGYIFGYWLVNGVRTNASNPLPLSMNAHTTVQAVFGWEITNFTDGDATMFGTLRHALENAIAGDYIRFSGVTPGTTIELSSSLFIRGNVTIEGNGLTLTRSASLTTGHNSNLLNISGTANISRLHFKDGRASNGAAIINSGTLNLESCVFSGNQTTSEGGAVYNTGTMSAKGCTFYGNKAYLGGAIGNRVGTLTLTGNLFYGNTASFRPALLSTGTVTSGGYNVVDVALGTGDTESGWIAAPRDKTISDLPVSPVSFKVISGSGAANVITTLPPGYPTTDFYGNSIANGAAAGAVQTTVDGVYLDLSVNDSSRGSVSASSAPNADGLYSGTVTLTASPQSGYIFGYWLVNGVRTNDPTLTLSQTTTVQAVFGWEIANFSDAVGSATTSGTLRHALANAAEYDYIRFSGVTPGTTTIELTSALPQIIRNITIEGNGLILTASWTTVNGSSHLLENNAYGTVNISRLHFKGGRASYGAAISNGGTLNLESCVFSDNQTGGKGGAVYNSGAMSIKGCTFYRNTADYSGAIYNESGGMVPLTLTFTGNLFYSNTASNSSPVVYRDGEEDVKSGGYNVVDVALGTGAAESGWSAGTGDTTFATLNIPGVPFDPSTFRPVSGLGSVMPSSALADFPATDFYGAARTWPGAPGAVSK